MKNNKWNKIWIAGLAALVILILLLTMCTGPKEIPVETLPTETAEQLLAAPTEQTQAEPETTAPTEETTQPTEETTQPTEPTEETTAPTTGNNNSGNNNSGNNNSGSGNTGTTKPTEPPLEVPDAGTEKNPYVEVVSEYPSKVTTVSIPASGGINYLISGAAGNVITIDDPNAKVVCGDKTYTPDENGVLTMDFSEMDADAVISISNSSKEDRAYVLHVSEPLGTRTNPEVLDDLNEISVKLKADDADGHYFRWTATSTGTLELWEKKAGTASAAAKHAYTELMQAGETEMEKPAVVPETISADRLDVAALASALEEVQTVAAVTPNMDIILTVETKTYKLSEFSDAVITAKVEKLQNVLIQVSAVPDEAGTYPEISAVLTGTFTPDPGTEENPYEYTLAGVPDTLTTVEIPAESQVYYRLTGAAGTVLTISDQACIIHENVTYGPTVNGCVWVELPADAAEPILLAVGNQNTAAKALAVNFNYKGSAACPEILTTIETITAALAEGDLDGYFYQWTAADPGTVTLTLDAVTPEGAACDVTLSVSGTDRTTTLVDGTASIALKAGESLIIQVAAKAEEDGFVPALELSLTGSFAPAPGTSADNPLVISDTSIPTALTVGAEKTFYISGDFHGQILTIWDAADATLTYNDQIITPDEFGTITLTFPEAEGETTDPIALSLTSDTEWEYTLVFSYPLGTAQNPDTMVLEENQATLEANDDDGYTFLWYADIEGELTITMPEDTAWQYTMDGVTHTSAEDPEQATVTIAVTVGQEVLFTVNTFEPASDETPAGTVTFNVSFYDPTLGTEANPIYLELTDSITIPAGQTVYYTVRVDGMTMTLTGENVKLTHNGVEYVPANDVIDLICKGSGMMQPPVFAITNTAEEDKTCTVKFTYPLGHQENPDQLKLGQTKITLAAGDEDGYCFVWRAEGSGSFTITMTEGTAWQYVVNNLTSFVSGELHVSDDDPTVLSETVTVSAGDEIRIIVNTYDPENPFAPPGGELIFQTAFVPDAE